MRKSFLIYAIFTSLLIISFTTAKAQKENKQFSVGFGLEGGVPVGDAKSTYDFDGGITLRFSYHVGPGFAMLTSGAVGFYPKSDLGDNTKATLQIPIKPDTNMYSTNHSL
ncbi:MAG: hypothetical protein ABI091_23600 [Ferruginibacter sp.]